MYLIGGVPPPATTAVFVARISSANVHPHIVSVNNKIFLILYAANVSGSGDNFIFCNKFTKKSDGIIDGTDCKIF